MNRTIVLCCLAACTQRNPDVCCETPDECLRLGFDRDQACAVGVCVGNLCVDQGACDGDEDCAAPMTCSDGACVAPPDGPLPIPPRMIRIPAGPFTRGCNASVEMYCTTRPDELPMAIVTLDEFLIDDTEVTSYAYQECITAGACPASSWYEFDPINRPLHPASGVSWSAARGYCAWRGLRLPTEAEWEKAARGVNGFAYPWGNVLPYDRGQQCTLSYFGDCPGADQWALPVASLPMGDSPYGVHDMAGNVFEWVEDLWGPTYYSTAPTTNPTGPTTPDADGNRIVRGGGWAPFPGLRDVRWIRAASRNPWPESSAGHPSVGFRCARSR